MRGNYDEAIERAIDEFRRTVRGITDGRCEACGDKAAPRCFCDSCASSEIEAWKSPAKAFDRIARCWTDEGTYGVCAILTILGELLPQVTIDGDQWSEDVADAFDRAAVALGAALADSDLLGLIGDESKRLLGGAASDIDDRAEGNWTGGFVKCPMCSLSIREPGAWHVCSGEKKT